MPSSSQIVDRGKGLEIASDKPHNVVITPWEQAWGDNSHETGNINPSSQAHHFDPVSASKPGQVASSSTATTIDHSVAILTQPGSVTTPHPFDTWSALYPASPHVSSYNPSTMAAALQGLNTNVGPPVLPLASSGQPIRSWTDLLGAVTSSSQSQTRDRSTSQQLLKHQDDLYQQRQLRQLHKLHRLQDTADQRTHVDQAAPPPQVPLQASRSPCSKQDAIVASVAGTTSQPHKPFSPSSSPSTTIAPPPSTTTFSTSLQTPSQEISYYVPKWSKRKLKGSSRKRKQREYEIDGSSYYYIPNNNQEDEREDEPLWRNDAAAEALYDKAEEIFAAHLAMKNRFKESQMLFKFGLSVDEKEALGEVGQRMYHALRQHYHYVKYEVQHPDRHKLHKLNISASSKEEEIKVLMTSIKYIRSKLNDIRRGAFKGTSFTKSDLEKVAQFLHYVQQCQETLPKKQSLSLFRKAVYLLQVIREVRPFVQEDWLLDPYTRHVFKEVNPMPYFDDVFKIMLF